MLPWWRSICRLRSPTLKQPHQPLRNLKLPVRVSPESDGAVFLTSDSDPNQKEYPDSAVWTLCIETK